MPSKDVEKGTTKSTNEILQIFDTQVSHSKNDSEKEPDIQCSSEVISRSGSDVDSEAASSNATYEENDEPENDLTAQ